MPKVSVIIPVYGVEKYIERCARSLFEQTLQDIEYIFVDDCTKDKSIEILKRVSSEYPHRLSQIKIVHHNINKGLPQARKTGVLNSSGDYIAHCDSDDYVAPEIYQKALDSLTTNDSDIVLINNYYSSNSSNIMRFFINSTDKVDLIKKMFSNRIGCSIWSKIAKRDIYFHDRFVFPIHNMGEDLVLSTQLLLYSKKVSVVDEPLYFYVNNSTSITKDLTEEKIYKNFLQVCCNLDLVENILKFNKVDITYTQELIALKYYKRDMLYPLANRNKYRNIYFSTYPDINNKIFQSRYITFKSKIKYLFLHKPLNFLLKYISVQI